MAFLLYDYLSQTGNNEFQTWTEQLQKVQRAKLNARLDMLENHGDGLFPEILTGTNTPGILKLRVKGNVQLRPMLCKGPIEIEREYTLLLGAVEIGGKLKPTKADELANDCKAEVLQQPNTRRKKHERIS